jgi:hypothetical protein
VSVVALRTYEDPFYTLTVTLDGSDYLFDFRYNQRADAWYFDFGLTDGTILLRGIKVVCNRSLLGRFADARLPPGTLIAFSSTTSNAQPGLLEIGEGKRVQLQYWDAAEVAANAALDA